MLLCYALWRLSVARAAPALDEDGCDSDYAGPQRSEDVGAPMRLSNCGCLPQNGPQNEPRSPAEEHRSFGRAARALPL